MVFCDVQRLSTGYGTRDLFLNYRQYGINGNLLNRISDYLHDRKQRVVIRSCMSDFKRVNAGVPQGSVLGPLLFFYFRKWYF